MSNKSKAAQLAMPMGTAHNKLVKLLIFDRMKKLNIDFCFACGNRIETVNDLSIGHKKSWADNVDLFWDMDNIALRHTHCKRS